MVAALEWFDLFLGASWFSATGIDRCTQLVLYRKRTGLQSLCLVSWETKVQSHGLCGVVTICGENVSRFGGF